MRVGLCGLGLYAGLSGIAYADTSAKPVARPTPVSNEASPVIGGYPKWSDFPAVPKNVPTVADFAQRVQLIDRKDVALDSEVQAIVWDKVVPVELGAQLHSQIDPAQLQSIDPPMTAQQSDALAASLRAKATPPPVVH